MKYFFALSILLTMGCIQVGYAQPRIHPYVGGSLNFLGISNPGWGIEGGIKYKSFYAGLEYGAYGHPEPLTVNFANSQTYSSYHPTFENYYGLHGGVVIDSIAYLGLVFLHSYQYEPEGASFIYSSWFNIGPDVRFQTWDHLMVKLAYTIRRGLDAGINFLF